MKATKDTLISAARTVALESSVNAGRIAPALLSLEDCSGPLRAAGSEGSSSSSDHPDPTFAAAGKRDEAAADRARVERLLFDMLRLSAELSNLLSSWAPDEAKQAELRGVRMSNEDMWCPNHRLHGMNENRSPGRKLCDFCDGFQREHKVLPGRWLLDVRARRRINSADLAKGVAEAKAAARREREEAKASRKVPAASAQSA
jgi:hypothetical protein